MIDLIIAGTRSFGRVPWHRTYAYAELDRLFLPQRDRLRSILCGRATGADEIGESWAIDRQMADRVIPCPADWTRLGRAAGPVRNSEMAEQGNTLVLFWDGTSPGSRDMLWKALNNGLWVKVYRYDQWGRQA